MEKRRENLEVSKDQPGGRGYWGCISGATTRGKGLAGPRQLGVGAGGCQGGAGGTGSKAALGGISRGHRWQRVHGQTQPPHRLARAVGTAGHTDVSRAGVHAPPQKKTRVHSLGWDSRDSLGAAPARTYQLHAAGVAIPALGALLQHAGGSRLQRQQRARAGGTPPNITTPQPLHPGLCMVPVPGASPGAG